MRLQTLVLLRWLAVGGQAIGVLFVAFGLGFPLPLLECFALIASRPRSISGSSCAWALPIGPASLSAASQIVFDLCQLGGLLALTGGLQNPFSLLLLAPVSVSATTLPQRATFLSPSWPR